MPDIATPRIDQIELRAAAVDGTPDKCVSTYVILPVPRYLDPLIRFDAAMRYLLIATGGPAEPSATLYEMNWERSEDGKTWGVQPPRHVTVVTDPKEVEQVRRDGGGADVQSLETWRSVGGRAFTVDDQNWRIVETSAQVLEAKPGEFKPLKLSDQGSACAKLVEKQSKLDSQEGFNVSSTHAYEDDEHCYLIKRGNPADNEIARTVASPSAKEKAAGTVVPRDEIVIAVYPTPSHDATDGSSDVIPTPVASLQFGRYERVQNRWHIGVSGVHEGWIALLHPDYFGDEALVGVPATTGALLCLGEDVLAKQGSRPQAEGC